MGKSKKTIKGNGLFILDGFIKSRLTGENRCPVFS